MIDFDVDGCRWLQPSGVIPLTLVSIIPNQAWENRTQVDMCWNYPLTVKLCWYVVILKTSFQCFFPSRKTCKQHQCHKYWESNSNARKYILHTRSKQANTHHTYPPVFPPTVSLLDSVGDRTHGGCALMCVPFVSLSAQELISVPEEPRWTPDQMHRCMRCTHAWGVCVCEGPACTCVVCWGPSGQPCHAVVPVKCCQRGRCGRPWRLEACCTALPAQAADLRKGNLGC